MSDETPRRTSDSRNAVLGCGCCLLVVAIIVGQASLTGLQRKVPTFPTSRELTTYGRRLPDGRMRRDLFAVIKAVFVGVPTDDDLATSTFDLRARPRRPRAGAPLYSRFDVQAGGCEVFSRWPYTLLAKIRLHARQPRPSPHGAFEAAKQVVRLPAGCKFTSVHGEGRPASTAPYVPDYRAHIEMRDLTYTVRVRGTTLSEVRLFLICEQSCLLQHAARDLQSCFTPLTRDTENATR